MPEEEPELVEEPEAAPEAPPPPEPAEFPFLTCLPEITFATRSVQPPVAYYMGPDDWLSAHVFNAVPGAGILLVVRSLRPDGQLQHSAHRWAPTADRAINEWFIPIQEGFLVGVLLAGYNGTKSGSCFARLVLRRGRAQPDTLSYVIVRGYAVEHSHMTWPYPRLVGPGEGPGWRHTVTGTTPPPGAMITEYPPARARWRILGVTAYFITAAGGSDRQVYLALGRDTAVTYASGAPAAQPAGQTWLYSWAPGAARAAVPATYMQTDALPVDTILTGDAWIGIDAWGMQPGDQFGAPRIDVEDWVEP